MLLFIERVSLQVLSFKKSLQCIYIVKEFQDIINLCWDACHHLHTYPRGLRAPPKVSDASKPEDWENYLSGYSRP